MKILAIAVFFSIIASSLAMEGSGSSASPGSSKKKGKRSKGKRSKKKGNRDLQLAWNAGIIKLWESGELKDLHDANSLVLLPIQGCLADSDLWPFPEKLSKKGSLKNILDHGKITMGFPGNVAGTGEVNCENYQCHPYGTWFPGQESGLVPDVTRAVVEKISEHYFDGRPNKILIDYHYISDSSKSFDVLDSGEVDILDGFYGGGRASRDIFFAKMCPHIVEAEQDAITETTAAAYPTYNSLKLGVSTGDLTVGTAGAGSKFTCDARYGVSVELLDSPQDVLKALRDGDIDIACQGYFPGEDDGLVYRAVTNEDGFPIVNTAHYFGRLDK